MPASYASFVGFLFCLCALVLSACSRDNSLSVPEAYIAPDKLNCEDIPPDDLVLLKGINISNSIISPKFDLNAHSYTAHVDYLVDSIVVSPDQINAANYDDINGVSVLVGDEPIEFNRSSGAILLAEGSNEIVVTVDAVVKAIGAEDECVTKDSEGNITRNSVRDLRTYTITVTRGLLADVDRQALEPIPVAVDPGDGFGHSISISSDTMAVGVYRDDSSARGVFNVADLQNELEDDSVEDSGAVYIYKRNTNGEWQHTFFIKSSNSEAGDLFGSSVSLHGDLLVVSAPGEDSHASGFDGRQDSVLSPDSGAVYIFKRDLTGWKQLHYVKSPYNSIGAGGSFGEQIVIKDDLLVVSAPGPDSFAGQGKQNTGKVFIYRYKQESGSWQSEATLIADISQNNERFGASIAFDGNMIVVGAPYEDRNLSGVFGPEDIPELEPNDPQTDVSKTNSGAAYVIANIAGGWAQTAYIKAPNADEGDLFGSAVAVSGKYIAIGAKHEDGNGAGFNRNLHNNDLLNSGAAYLYELKANGWTEIYYIKPFAGKANSEFGSAIAFDGNDLLIGAPLFDNAEENSLGRVFGYSVVDSVLNQDYVKKSVLDQVGEYYGEALAIYGSTVVVGAEGHSHKESGPELENSGIVYVYQ